MSSFSDRLAGAIKLQPATYEEVEADRSATGQAMLVVVLASVASGLGLLRLFGPLGILQGTITALIGWFVWALLTYAIGVHLLPQPQTRSSLGEMLRTTGFAAAPGIFRILQLVPLVGAIVAMIVAVWMLAAMVIAVRQALDYTSTLRAVAVCIVGWLVYVAIGLLLFPLAG
jgi:hypothetical protein